MTHLRRQQGEVTDKGHNLLIREVNEQGLSQRPNFLLARSSKLDDLEPQSAHTPTAEQGAGGKTSHGLKCTGMGSPSAPGTSGEGGDFIPGH